MMNRDNSEQLKPFRPAWSRAEMVFVVASVTLLLAFVIPVPEIILDILWGFTFCLAGAAIIICLGAQNSSDLGGFVPVVSGLILLRLFVLAASSRRIIQEEARGILINSFGNLLAGNRPLGAVLICLLLAVICVIVIFSFSQKIASASKNYIRQILPLKKIGLETDLRMGIIDETNAKSLSGRILSEFRFFSGMNGTSLLMRSESAICIFILLACLILPTLTEQFEGVSGQDYISKTAPAVLALSLFTLLPALIVATACGRLMSEETLALRSESKIETKPSAKKIKIISKDTGAEEEIELLNPEFVEHENVDDRIVEFEVSSKTFSYDQSQIFSTADPSGNEISISPEPQPLTEDDAYYRPRIPDSNLSGGECDVMELPCSDVSDYYEKISQLICEPDSYPHVALLASDQIQSLPATVGVNVAIMLAQKQHNLLLVDTDTQRNAIAQIFEIDRALLQQNVMPSCLEKLSVYSIPVSNLQTLLNNKTILKQFSITMIYMPNTSGLSIEISETMVKPDVLYFSQGRNQSLKEFVKNRFGFGQSVRIIPDIRTILEQRTPEVSSK